MKETTALQRLRRIAAILERARGRMLTSAEVWELYRIATEGVPARGKAENPDVR